MSSNLYSWRQIQAEAKKTTPVKLTRTQTAKQAKMSIQAKYKGSIPDVAKFYHRGNGDWVRYSLKNDSKRTGKTTTNLIKWRKAPHRIDYTGKDTATTTKVIPEKKTVAKQTLISKIRAAAKSLEYNTRLWTEQDPDNPRVYVSDRFKSYGYITVKPRRYMTEYKGMYYENTKPSRNKYVLEDIIKKVVEK